MLSGQSPKPFGLGNVAPPAAVSNQWLQSAGQVRPINCSKSRRVFVNSLLVGCRLAFASVCLSCRLCCLYLFCSLQFLAFHNLTDMRQVIYPPPRPKINSSQCKLLPLGRRVTSSIWLSPSAQSSGIIYIAPLSKRPPTRLLVAAGRFSWYTAAILSPVNSLWHKFQTWPTF